MIDRRVKWSISTNNLSYWKYGSSKFKTNLKLKLGLLLAKVGAPSNALDGLFKPFNYTFS